MPRRTVEPEISSTVMVMSSPRTTCSPERRVMTSISLHPRCGDGSGRVGRRGLAQLDVGEERLADVVVAGLVDDLPAEPARGMDHDGPAQVDGEVLELLGGADDAEDVGLLGGVEAQLRG